MDVHGRRRPDGPARGAMHGPRGEEREATPLKKLAMIITALDRGVMANNSCTNKCKFIFTLRSVSK